MKTLWLLLMLTVLATLGEAQTPSTNRAWRYVLLDGSTITDDCPICGRPVIPYPLRGTFDLFLDGSNPLFTTYRITNIYFYAGIKDSPLYTVEGNGVYRVGGEVVVQQELTLQTTVCSSTPECRDVTLTNQDVVPVRFPLIQISVTQTQASLFSVLTLQLIAAPVRELWFVVTNGFVPTNGAPAISAGDVLSQSGRVVRRSNWLLESNGVPAPAAGLRVDALDAAPGGELVFSTSYPNLSALRDGDLFSERGYTVRSNHQLTASFGIQPVVPDVGLDAVQVMESGEILFSIRTNIFAEGKNLLLRHGDLLSSLGQIIKRNAQLLERFHPGDTNLDYGLDAVYVWPNNEIWFSTTTAFVDQQLGPISDGDLLSSEGVIVFKNRDLVADFGAPGGEGAFGLGDVFVVTDASVGAAPKLQPMAIAGTDVWLRWTGSNRVFRVLRATDVTGFWMSSGEIDPAPFFRDPGALIFPRAFYRIEAW